MKKTVVNRHRAMKKCAGYLLLFLVLLTALPLFPLPVSPLQIDNKLVELYTSQHMEYFEDTTGALEFADIRSGSNSPQFQPLPDQWIRLGYTRSVFWFRLEVNNLTANEIAWYLTFYGDTHEITLFYPRQKDYARMRSGDRVPVDSWPVRAFSYAFPLVSPPGEQVLYARVKGSDPIFLYPMALSPDTFRRREMIFHAMAWLLFGIMLALAVYNIFIYLSLKETGYLYLFFFILSYTATLAWEAGFIRPYWNVVGNLLGPLFFVISLIALVLLTRSFLNTPRNTPRLDIALRVLCGVFVASLCLHFILSEYFFNQLVLPASLITVGLLILCGILSLKKGGRPARFFMIGSSLFLVGMFMMLIDLYGLLPLFIPFHVFSVLGFLLMVFFLSFGITDKFNTMRNERLDALEQLEKSERRLRSIFSNAVEGIYQLCPTRGLITANPAMARIFGFDSVEEFQQLPNFTSLLDKETPVKILRILKKGKPVNAFESRAFRKDGRTIYVSISAHQISDDNGELRYYEGFMTDITERKHSEKLLRMSKLELEERVAERTIQLARINDNLLEEINERKKIEDALTKSEERHRHLIETMNEGFAILDENFTVQYVNPKLREMFAHGPDESINRSVFEFLDEKNRKLMKEQLMARQQGVKEPYEIEWLRSDGATFTAIVAPHPILDDQGRFSGSSAVLTDITARKEMEAQLLKAKAEAERANRAKSEFLANMSHEIRTPLNAVLGFTELLSAMLSDKKQRNYLDSIKSSGKNLLMLINDILDLSRIEAGKLDLQFEPVNLYSIAQEIKQVFSLKIEEKGIVFISDISPDIPECLLLDEVRLRQILFNLIGNSVKFTHQGHIRLAVKKIYTQEDKSNLDLLVTVEDTGIGIGPESQAKIFDAFRQQDGQSTKKYGGTGLGLAITRRLVEMLGGDISLSSEIGEGTTFEILLRDVAVAAARRESLMDEIYDWDELAFEPAVVLVVDDVAANRVLVREFLLQKFLTVIEAEDGLQALEMAAQHMPGAILMDIKMPRLDGYGTNRRIKEDEKLKHIPVIALTASAMRGDMDRILREGFEGFLHKPVQVNDLFRELARYLPHTRQAPAENGVNGNGAAEPGPGQGAHWREISPELSAEIPALLEFLENDGVALWENARKNGFFNDIREFGEKLKHMGENYRIIPIQEYGDELMAYVAGFDIENMNAQLATYPQLVEQVKALQNGGPGENGEAGENI